jgi:ribosomal protein S18 acetylase RimI-like enzyme
MAFLLALGSMPAMTLTTRYRSALAEDAEAIAALHTDSWRRHYRGAFSDAYLDGDVAADRLAVWTDRLAAPRPEHRTILVELGDHIVGFAHTVLDDDPTWGALLDNLHVRHDVKGRGLGTGLMAETAAAVAAWDPSSGLYLWVLEQNRAAQAFYEALGGTPADRQEDDAPGGGTVVGIRYVWPEPSTLVVRSGRVPRDL